MSECPFKLPIRSHKSSDGFIRIRGNNGHAICKNIAEKDEADYIARAVNCHEKLVKAVKETIHWDNMSSRRMKKSVRELLDEALAEVEKP